MRRGAVFRERHRARRVQQRREIKVEFEPRVAREVECGGEIDARAVRIVREVEGETVELRGSVSGERR